MTIRRAAAFGSDMRLAILAVAALTSTAHADDQKSPAVATWSSVGVTLGGLALGAAGGNIYVAGAALAIGPSVGHWYAGELGGVGLALRGAGVGAIALSVDGAAACSFGGGSSCGTDGAILAVGGGLVIAGMLYDFGTAGGAARRRNARVFQIAPTVVSGTRSNGAGIGFSGAF